jgi:hypothetical protein
MKQQSSYDIAACSQKFKVIQYKLSRFQRLVPFQHESHLLAVSGDTDSRDQLTRERSGHAVAIPKVDDWSEQRTSRTLFENF